MLPNVLSDGALLVKLFPEQDNKTLGSQVTEEDAEEEVRMAAPSIAGLYFPDMVR